MHPDYQKYSPFRAPQWRYDRVLELIEARPVRSPSPRSDDRFVRTYHKFLMRYMALPDADKVTLYPKNPGLFYAHLLHHHPDREWRVMVQARILTSADDNTAANYLSTLPDTIHWYEALYFNVRDRLNNLDWIIKSVLGSPAERVAARDDTMTMEHRHILYKLFAYFGGPHILDAVLAGVQPNNLPKDRTQVSRWFDQTMKTLLKRKAIMAAQMFEVNKWNVMELMNAHISIMSLEKDAGGGPQSEIEKAVEGLLGQIGGNWRIARKRLDEQPALEQQYAISAVEPRADEFASLAHGTVPATLREQEAAIDTAKLVTVPEG